MRDIEVGTSKIISKDIRGRYEPDIVVKMPGSGDKRARTVGEIKFCGTCNISKHWVKHDTFETYGPKRHIFGMSLLHNLPRIKNLLDTITGQVARDMKVRGTRFGYVSTYEETVFLKIVIQRSDKEPALLYSEPIK
jgi:hypothetical protein